MNNRIPNPDDLAEVWLLTSELESERAGSFRQERWCQAFLRLGKAIVVYNVRGAGAFSLTEIRFRSEEEFISFRKRAVSDSIPRAAIREGHLVPILRRLKHISLVDLYYPNILRILWRTSRKLSRNDRPVVIMSSSPPFSLALAGALLKTFYSKRVILAIDMRDPWTFHRSLGGLRPLKRWIEGKVLRKADYLSTVSIGVADEFKQHHGTPAEVIYNVASHYNNITIDDPTAWKELDINIDAERIKVVYTGSTPERYYDLPALARAIKSLREHSPDVADRIQLIFVGACGEFRRELDIQGIKGTDVIFVPHVAQRKARAIQQSADVLLYLTYLGKGAVSAKIFEYMALGKPILPISVPKDSDADILFKAHCSFCHYLTTPEEIAAGLSWVAENAGFEKLPRLTHRASLDALLEAYEHHSRRVLSHA